MQEVLARDSVAVYKKKTPSTSLYFGHVFLLIVRTSLDILAAPSYQSQLLCYHTGNDMHRPSFCRKYISSEVPKED